MVDEIEGVVYEDVAAPPVNGEPPVFAANQSNVIPEGAEAFKVTDPVPQRDADVADGAAGAGVTSILPEAVLVPAVQPPVIVTV